MATTLVKASFAGISFPVDEITVQGGQRYHIHEYPHSPGGQPEKLGRKLYVVRFRAWFHELAAGSRGAKLYPDLWPNGLKKLRTQLEDGTTQDLTVPTVGTIQAFPTAWTQKWAAQVALDGEKVDLEFCEDQEALNLGGTDFEVAAASLVAANSELQDAANLAAWKLANLPRKPGLFEAINNAVGAVLAVRDSVGAAASLVAAKLDAVSSLCNELEKTVDVLGGASFVQVAQSTRNLSFAAGDAAAKLAGPEKETMVYIVPSKTSVAELSQRLYGDTEHVGAILKQNAFVDAFNITAGTTVLYQAS